MAVASGPRARGRLGGEKLGFVARLSTAFAFARRELRGGLRSFRVFLACLALGVAGVAGVGSVIAAIEAGLASKGRELLGGDVEIELTYRLATTEERAAFAQLGEVVETIDARGMARIEGDAAIVQVKAVEAAYPLYGAVTLEPAIPLGEALGVGADGLPGAVAEPALITRLALKIGDTVELGDQTFRLNAAVTAEPDRVVGGLGAFGPRFMISREAVEATGLAQPGTLFDTEYKIKLDPALAGADLEAERAQLEAAFPDSGWSWRDHREGPPGVGRVLSQLGAFLILVGLAALAVGGVGVGASVRAYLESKTETIATLKTLGADGAMVSWVYLLQITALSLLGVGLGLAIGAAVPLLLAETLAARLPTPTRFGVYPEPLLEAAAYGLMVAFLFALWPLARAREIRAAGLFRDLVAPERRLPPLSFLVAMAALAALITLAAIVFTGTATLSLGFVIGVALALLALSLASFAVGRLARWLARTSLGRGRLPIRLALSGVAGPDGAGGGETRGAVLALGLGLTVLAAIGLVDYNLRKLVVDQLPQQAPAYFVIDIQNADLPSFLETTEALPGVERVETAPMLRGLITRINDMSAEDWTAAGNVAEGFEWVLAGDRGVTYADRPPPGTTVLAGEWWAEDYSGEPLVSFGAEQGRGIGLSLGDRITVNVLGRDITGRIANFREVEFRTGGINFLMLFEPSVLRGAPHAHIATLYGEEPEAGAYLRRIATEFSAVTAIRVEEVLERAESVLLDVAAAARAGASATLITGLAVLIGATAAGQRRRIYDAAILKTLGATRGSILSAMTLRSALLGLAAALVALAAGAAAAWGVVTFVFQASFAFDFATAAAILLGGVAATLLTGALFSLGPLSARPARILRARE
ncbi:MAG: FtsX-like permease family protein [Pseudomonadota bacterium]